MKKIRKSILTGAAALLLTSMLGACGNSNGNNAAGETAGQNNANTGTTASTEPVTLDLFVDQSWWPLKNWSGEIPEEITKRTGIKLNITVATDEKQLPIMLASGDLPDLVVTSTQIKQMSNEDASYPWQELIDKYTPDFKIDQDRIAVNTASDGKFYTLKNNFSTAKDWEDNKEYALSDGAAISVRSDLMKEMGNPQIKTVADFENLLATVKTKYPDMIPLALNTTATWSKGYFAQNFGAAISGLVERDGKMVYTLNTPQLKNMYLYMNELYRKGYIKAENLAYKSEDQAKQLATTGKAFAYTWDTSGSDRLNAATKDVGYTWEQLPIKISDDFVHERYDNGWQGVFITKNNKNPEASIKLMQFLTSEEGQKLALWGKEGTDWNYSKDGKYPVFTFNFTDEDIRAQKGSFYWGLLAGSAVTQQLAFYSPGTQTTKSNKEISDLTTFKPEVGLVTPDGDSEEQVISTNLENLIKNEEAKVLLADSAEDASKAYDAIVQQGNKMGMADLETWANKKYAEVQKLFK